LISEIGTSFLKSSNSTTPIPRFDEFLNVITEVNSLFIIPVVHCSIDQSQPASIDACHEDIVVDLQYDTFQAI